MATIERYNYNSTIEQIRHDTRVLPHESDIDKSRSSANYSLTPGMNIPREEQYERRDEVASIEIANLKKSLNDIYVYNREKQNITVGTVISLPNDVKPEDEERFFKAVVDFSEEKIGTLVLAHVHVDEQGEHHLHLLNLPLVDIDHEAIERKVALSEERGSKSRIPLALREKKEDGSYLYDKKLSYDELIGGVKGRIKDARTGKHEETFLEGFHRDLQVFLKERGIPGTVKYKPEGDGKHINIPVSALKDYTARTGRKIDRETLKNLTVDKVIDALDKAREKSKERDAWGRKRSWGEKERGGLTW